MEWVEVESKTVDLAVDVAMTELGISSREDVDVEIVQEPKPGFLGMGGREAIVRVTKTQKKRRRRRGRGRNGSADSRDNQSQERSSQKKSAPPASKSRSKSGNSGTSRNGDQRRQEKRVSETKDSRPEPRDDRPEQAPIEEQADVAARFLTGLIGSFGLEGSVETRIDDDVLYLDVTGGQTEALVGSKGSVMQSVLELTRTVVQRKTYGAPRMRIDIAGYVERRREALKIYAGKLAAQVIEDESEIMLEAMNAADRKVVHDAVAEIDGVRSFSEGEDPRRAVVIAFDRKD